MSCHDPTRPLPHNSRPWRFVAPTARTAPLSDGRLEQWSVCRALLASGREVGGAFHPPSAPLQQARYPEHCRGPQDHSCRHKLPGGLQLQPHCRGVVSAAGAVTAAQCRPLAWPLSWGKDRLAMTPHDLGLLALLLSPGLMLSVLLLTSFAAGG